MLQMVISLILISKYKKEHFIVWARNSGLSTFRKLWGELDIKDGDTFVAGKYTVDITNSIFLLINHLIIYQVIMLQNSREPRQ